jgi:hypothetical protein
MVSRWSSLLHPRWSCYFPLISNHSDFQISQLRLTKSRLRFAWVLPGMCARSPSSFQEGVKKSNLKSHYVCCPHRLSQHHHVTHVIMLHFYFFGVSEFFLCFPCGCVLTWHNLVGFSCAYWNFSLGFTVSCNFVGHTLRQPISSPPPFTQNLFAWMKAESLFLSNTRNLNFFFLYHNQASELSLSGCGAM